MNTFDEVGFNETCVVVIRSTPVGNIVWLFYQLTVSTKPPNYYV